MSVDSSCASCVEWNLLRLRRSVEYENVGDDGPCSQHGHRSLRDGFWPEPFAHLYILRETAYCYGRHRAVIPRELRVRRVVAAHRPGSPSTAPANGPHRLVDLCFFTVDGRTG